jgi:hypothetical protein
LGADGRDLRHIFQSGTYDLPFGKGRHFNIDSTLMDSLLGGWATSAIVRWQAQAVLAHKRSANLQSDGLRA